MDPEGSISFSHGKWGVEIDRNFSSSFLLYFPSFSFLVNHLKKALVFFADFSSVFYLFPTSAGRM
jgi:hypothetical protein